MYNKIIICAIGGNLLMVVSDKKSNAADISTALDFLAMSTPVINYQTNS